MTRDRLNVSRAFCAILSKPLAKYDVVINYLSPPLQTLIDVVDHRMDDVLPDGSAVVDRARFERLLECVESAMSLEAVEPRSSVSDPAWYRWRAAFSSIQSGDLDPLP